MNMTLDAPSERTVHQGQNIRRIRDLLCIKQDDLAGELGLSQQAVSQLEQKEKLDPEMLERVAKVLKVSPEAIKNFSEEAAVTFVNTFNDHSVSHVIGNYGTYNFNPVEKWMEALEEIKRLGEQNVTLHERLIKSEQEKVAMLQALLEKTKQD